MKSRLTRLISIFAMIIVLIGGIFLIETKSNAQLSCATASQGETEDTVKAHSGDADKNGILTAADARLALRFAVGLDSPDEEAFLAADVDEDGKITAADARIILRLSVGLTAEETPEEKAKREQDTAKRIAEEKAAAEKKAAEEKAAAEKKAAEEKAAKEKAEAEKKAAEEKAAKEKAKSQYFTPELTEANVPKGAKIIYLTFDDGPSANTVKVLDILDKYNVKATFFVIYNEEYSYLYKEIIKRGHSIGLHSYTHTYSKIYKSTTAYFDDLNKISDVVYKNTGVRTRLMRFPGGSSNTVSKRYCKGIMSTLVKQTQQKGYVYFDWNAANNDATGEILSAEQIKNVAISYAGRSPLVMLMHDASDKTNTVKALPEIIEYYKNKGYYFLPLNENSPTAHHKIAN